MAVQCIANVLAKDKEHGGRFAPPGHNSMVVPGSPRCLPATAVAIVPFLLAGGYWHLGAAAALCASLLAVGLFLLLRHRKRCSARPKSASELQPPLLADSSHKSLSLSVSSTDQAADVESAAAAPTEQATPALDGECPKKEEHVAPLVAAPLPPATSEGDRLPSPPDSFQRSFSESYTLVLSRDNLRHHNGILIKRRKATDSDTDVPERPSKCLNVSYKPIVSCCIVPDICEMDKDYKSELWWQPEDFAEFLRVRIEFGRAYKEVAKKRGVPIGEVAHEPALSYESRRGLGLGRKRQRAQIREAYIAAVLKEQEDQRREARKKCCPAGEDPGLQPLPPNFRLDMEAIRRCAEYVSREDIRQARRQALMDYQDTNKHERQGERQLSSEDRSSKRDSFHKKESPPRKSGSLASSTTMPARLEELSVDAADDATSPHLPGMLTRRQTASAASTPTPTSQLQTTCLFKLRDEEDVACGLPPTMIEYNLTDEEHAIGHADGTTVKSGSSTTRGFGISRDMFAQAGLTAAGRAVSANAGGGWQPRPGAEDSDMESSCGEDIEDPGDKTSRSSPGGRRLRRAARQAAESDDLSESEMGSEVGSEIGSEVGSEVGSEPNEKNEVV